MAEVILMPSPEKRSAIVAKFASFYDYLLGNDNITLGHCKRSSLLYTLICHLRGIYFGLPEEEIEYSVFLHDKGKESIPGRIIRSRKVFSADSPEMERIREHPQNGADLLWDLPRTVIEVALYHHEWWNGGGYPHGIKGENIPEAARMMAIVDALDAILSERSYKKGKSLSEALKKIRDGSGVQFDPDMVIMVSDTIQLGGALVDQLFLRYYPSSLK